MIAQHAHHQCWNTLAVAGVPCWPFEPDTQGLARHTTCGGSSHAATWHSSCSSVRRSLTGVSSTLVLSSTRAERLPQTPMLSVLGLLWALRLACPYF